MHIILFIVYKHKAEEGVLEDITIYKEDSMKKQTEKKSITKSVKLSPQQYEQIQKDADAAGMNFSAYLVDCAVHKQGITPQLAVKIEEVAIAANEIAEHLYPQEYEAKETLTARTDELCELFHTLTPQERDALILKDNDIIQKGAAAIWESLK